MEEKQTKRILCIGRIHKGKKTMIIAFPQKGEDDHAISQSREGLLDVHGHITDRIGNSWSAWRQVTPKHNELVEAMLQSRCHIIATMRSKMEYTQVEENGKKQIKKLGMSPIQRDGMEYEFTTFFDLDQNHIVTATKDRTTLFDGQYFIPTIETGRKLLNWLENSGKEAPVPKPQEEKHPSPPEPKGEPEMPPQPELRAGTNGLKRLFAGIGNFNLSRETYKRYCYHRYGITSMTELTPEQIQEQVRLLDSLKRPVRLTEFKALLEKITTEGPETCLDGGEETPPPIPAQMPVSTTVEFNLF